MTDGGRPQIDAYLAGVDQPQRAMLEKLRATLRTVLPHAQEGMKYGMPCFSLDGKGVAGFAASAKHCGHYPMSGTVLAAAGDAVAGYAMSKGGLQFPVDKALPVGLVRTLVKLRLAELSDVRNGARTDHYPDGAIKARGEVKDGELHGRWEWFRKDGSLQRTGSFTRGEQSGTWETWDRDGNLVKATSFS